MGSKRCLYVLRQDATVRGEKSALVLRRSRELMQRSTSAYTHACFQAQHTSSTEFTREGMICAFLGKTDGDEDKALTGITFGFVLLHPFVTLDPCPQRRRVDRENLRTPSAVHGDIIHGAVHLESLVVA